MRRILRFSFIISVSFILFHTGVLHEVQADVGVPPSPGGVITTGDKTEKIAMKSEKVVFDIHPNDEDSPFYNEEYTSSIQRESQYAHVTADFVMKNVTSNNVSMDLMFPVPGNAGYGDDWKEYFDPENSLNPSINHQVLINGTPADIRYDAYDIENVMQNDSGEFYYPLYALVIEFKANFPANAKTIISVQYDVELYPYIKTIYGYFNYLLETGSHWKGTIGSGEIIFQFPDEIIPAMFDQYNDQFTLQDNRLIWTFSDLEPGKDENIIVQYSPYLYTIWNNRDTAFKSIKASWSDQFIIPYESPGDYFDKLMWWNLDGNPIYLLNRNSDAEIDYSRTQVGWWIASLKKNSHPWIEYEFDGSYYFDAMIINSGIVDTRKKESYELVARPKSIALTFSDASVRTVDLEDTSTKDIIVDLQNKQTSSVKVTILDVYQDYQGKSDYIGIDSIEFSPVGRLYPMSLYPEDEDDSGAVSDGISIPDIFLLKGSKTTRIDQMSSQQLEAVKNLTLDVVGKNKVVFSDSINLTGSETQRKLKKLIEYVDFNTIGFVSINTFQLPFLESPATVTMHGLTFSETPDIYKNGQLATSKEVKNKTYDSETGTLTFDVSAFSTYEARNKAPEVDLDELVLDGSTIHRVPLWQRIIMALCCLIPVILFLVLCVLIIIIIRQIKRKKGLVDEKKEPFSKKELKNDMKVSNSMGSNDEKE